ncbi:hypothetical protein M0802_004133 [Mischocyttarus mexicanus]|nr:hypothetical protein M0802_004133 [Mischocyttarus mexicanus]
MRGGYLASASPQSPPPATTINHYQQPTIATVTTITTTTLSAISQESLCKIYYSVAYALHVRIKYLHSRSLVVYPENLPIPVGVSTPIQLFAYIYKIY